MPRSGSSRLCVFFLENNRTEVIYFMIRQHVANVWANEYKIVITIQTWLTVSRSAFAVHHVQGTTHCTTTSNLCSQVGSNVAENGFPYYSGSGCILVASFDEYI